MKTRSLALIGGLATSMIGAFAATPTAWATTYSPTHIYLNSVDITNPSHTAATDPSTGKATTFMPIFYAEQVLDKIGITSKWDGHTWSLTVPSSLNPDLSNPYTGNNQMVITINGTPVEGAPKIIAVDPASKQQTTFVPVYYLAQVLNRLGITSTWDGTNWRLTQTQPVTQLDMANSMWNTFSTVNWDVVSHPSIAAVGITPSANTQVTAGDVATYLADWAAKAKGVTITWYQPAGYPQKGTFMPYNLKYDVSSDPYTWASINGLFQGTGVTSSSSPINSSEETTILSNLNWWLTGDRVVNGVHHLHVPFYSHYAQWITETGPKGVGNQISQSNYQSYLADEVRYFDEITVTVSNGGATLNLTLPNIANSASDMGWDISDNNFEYGGWQAKDNRGGKTIQVPNSNSTSFWIDGASLVPSMYLLTVEGSYTNVNGVPQFDHPYDSMDQQPLN